MSIVALAAAVIIFSAIANASVSVVVELEIEGGAIKIEDHQVYLATKTAQGGFQRVRKLKVWRESDEDAEANKREFTFLIDDSKVKTLQGTNTWVVVQKKLDTQAGGKSDTIVGSEPITESHKVTKPLLEQGLNMLGGGASAFYKVTVRVLRSLMD